MKSPKNVDVPILCLPYRLSHFTNRVDPCGFGFCKGGSFVSFFPFPSLPPTRGECPESCPEAPTHYPLLTTHFLFTLFHTFPQSHQTVSIPPTPAIPSTSATLVRIRAAPFE